MKDSIRHLIQQALDRLTAEGVLPAGLTPAIQVENTKDKSHGDFASNIAMMLAKPAGMKPRDLAEKLIAALPSDAQISKVEIAGPGFLNFYQDTSALAARLEGSPQSVPPGAGALLDLIEQHLAAGLKILMSASRVDRNERMTGAVRDNYEIRREAQACREQLKRLPVHARTSVGAGSSRPADRKDKKASGKAKRK